MNRFAENIYEGRGGNFSKAFLSGIGFLKKKKKQNKPKPEPSGEAQLKQLKITATIFFFNVHKINLQSPSPKSSLACGFHRRFALYLISQRLTNAAHLSSPRTAAILIIYSKELFKKKKNLRQNNKYSIISCSN